MTGQAVWPLIGLLVLGSAVAVMPVSGVSNPHTEAGESALARPDALPPPVQSARWQPFDQGLPTYALIVTVAVQPSDPATIYAGTYEPPGLWRSDDGGSSWIPDDQGLGGSPVYALHWDAVRQHWWIGARDGIYTRPSLEAPWQAATLGERAIYALAEDGQGRLYAGADDGLYRSDDADAWETLPLADDQAPIAVLALDVSPDGRTVLAGTAGHGAWISRNSGVAWSPAGAQATDTGETLAQAYVSAVLLDSQPGGAAYVSTSERAYRSEDGTAWQAIPALAGRVHAFASGQEGHMYAALAGQVARSVDEGRTWELVDAGLQPGDKMLDLAVVPDSPALIYAAAWDGLYVSLDDGQSWTRRSESLGYPDVNVLAWDGTGNLLAGTRAGLFRRAANPGAETAWQPVPDIQGRPVLSIAEAEDGRSFYAGCSNGLFRSTDGGQTWREVASELSGASIAGLLIDPTEPDHLHAWVAFGRVHESRDGGRNWAARWAGLGDVRPVAAIHRSATGQMYVGAEDGVFRWEPASQAWRPLPFPLAASTIFVVGTDARDPDALYAGATDGLWRSPDGGQTWSRWGASLDSALPRSGCDLKGMTVTSLAISPADQRIAFAGTRHMGLYVTNDGGATWQPTWEDRLATASVRDILFSNDGQVVYVASDQGLWLGEGYGAR